MAELTEATVRRALRIARRTVQLVDGRIEIYRDGQLADYRTIQGHRTDRRALAAARRAEAERIVLTR